MSGSDVLTNNAWQSIGGDKTDVGPADVTVKFIELWAGSERLLIRAGR